MDIRELGRLDLNLLVSLEALLEERSVSLAAERLFITQSAMSKTLGRLRALFDDPLFTRKSSHMVPTPRAMELAAHLPDVLQAVQTMIQPAAFDPLLYDGEMELMLQGDMGVWIVPRLLARLHRTAPRMRLSMLSSAEQPLGLITEGELDFLLHAECKHYPPGFNRITLGYAPPVLLARKGHPLEGCVFSWDHLEDFPHVRLMLRELEEIQFQGDLSSPANIEFFRREREAVPQLRTDNLYTAIHAVLESDAVFPAPPLFIEQEDLAGELIALPWPGGVDLSLKYQLVSHERVDSSPAHAFLRDEILQIIELFRAQNGLPCLEDLRSQRSLEY